MRISDWSSDVCSSDLRDGRGFFARARSDQWPRSVAIRALVQPGRHPAPACATALGGWMLSPADRTDRAQHRRPQRARSEEHTSELQSLMRISYAVFCLKKKKIPYTIMYYPQDATTNEIHDTT